MKQRHARVSAMACRLLLSSILAPREPLSSALMRCDLGDLCPRSRRFAPTISAVLPMISAIFYHDPGFMRGPSLMPLHAPQCQPMPGCRHQLSYGGDDLDRMLLWILRRQARRDHAEITPRSRRDLDRMLLWILRRQARRDHAEITPRSRRDHTEITPRSR